jgi:hypothetical protein
LVAKLVRRCLGTVVEIETASGEVVLLTIVDTVPVEFTGVVVDAAAECFIPKIVSPSGPNAKGKPDVLGSWHSEVVALFVAVIVHPEMVLQVVEHDVVLPSPAQLVKHPVVVL